MKHIASVEQVPILPNTTYIVDVDGVLVIEVDDSFQAPNPGVIRWFNTLVRVVGRKNIKILTGRSILSYFDTMMDLNQAGFDITDVDINFNCFKADWIATFRETFEHQQMIVIDDQYHIMRGIEDTIPSVTCYYVNVHTINIHSVANSIKEVVPLLNTIYVLDVDSFISPTRSLLNHFFDVDEITEELKTWLKTWQPHVRFLVISEQEKRVANLGLQDLLKSSIHNDDKLVLISKNHQKYIELYLIYPNMRMIEILK